MTFYKRAYILDCAYHTSAVFPIVLAVSSLVFLSKLLSESILQALPAATLGHFLALTMLRYAPQLLVASLFTGMLLATTRAHTAREMEAWFSAGVGLRHFVSPCLTFAAPGVLAVLLFTVFISPWATEKMDLLRASLLRDISPDAVVKNAFFAPPGLGYVYFWRARDDAPDHIFIAATGGRRHEVIFTERANVDRALNLSRGKIYRVSRATPAVGGERLSFDAMRLALPPANKIEKRARATPSSELHWRLPRHRAEMVWRLNVPLSAVSLALLSLLAAHWYPRQSRAAVLLVGIAFFFINLNLLYYVGGEMKNDRLPAAAAVVLPPLAVWTAVWLSAKIFHRR